MALSQRVKFGGTTLATRLFGPRYGSPDYQTLRRHPFGLKGELELRGKTGGQTIVVPVRLFANSFSALRDEVKAAYAKIGEHDKLTLEFSTADRNPVGEVTLDAVEETTEARYVLFDTAANRAGWEVYLVLTFRLLKQE